MQPRIGAKALRGRRSVSVALPARYGRLLSIRIFVYLLILDFHAVLTARSNGDSTLRLDMPVLSNNRYVGFSGFLSRPEHGPVALRRQRGAVHCG